MGFTFVKVTKFYRNGEDTVVLPVRVEYNSDDRDWMVEEAVERWAENHTAGHNYGYRIEYDITKNLKDIEECLIKEIRRSDARLTSEKIFNEKLKEELNCVSIIKG